MVGLFIVGDGVHFVVVALVYFGLCFACCCVVVFDVLVVYGCFCLGCLWLGAYGLLLLVCVRLCSRCLFVDCGFCLVVCGLQVVRAGQWVLVVGVWLWGLCLVVGLVGLVVDVVVGVWQLICLLELLCLLMGVVIWLLASGCLRFAFGLLMGMSWCLIVLVLVVL